MAVDMKKALQTKCKTCFGGPIMILHAIRASSEITNKYKYIHKHNYNYKYRHKHKYKYRYREH